MATTRVYILAKELGVKSSAILEKCRNEGLDVKNHMTTISAGLAATICEWFSDGEHTTTIETAEKVDLKKVRVRKKPKRKKKAKKEEVAPQPEIAVVEEAAKPETPQPVPPTVKKKPKAAAKKKKPKPKPVKPAGPMLEKPAPAKLTGPTVVRVDTLKPPPRRTRHRPRYDEPVTQPLLAGSSERGQLKRIVTEDKKHPPKKHKDRTHGRRKTEVDIENARKAKLDVLRRQKDIEERRARLDAAGGEGYRVRPVRKLATKSERAMQAAVLRPEKAVISEPITVKDLSAALAVKTADIVLKLMQQNVMASANQIISSEVAELIALEFGTELVVEKKTTQEQLIRQEFEQYPRMNLTKRPVIATMLGHVDHGKTSLLDRIRSTQVTAGEAGGITQHISAYQVTHGDSKITFIDTPGHAAFTSMRARGANMTDLVVLVVAADDGVMPQTVEVINHAKAADVQVLVALNKCDLSGIDYNKIYAQLAEHDLAPVEWSGKTDLVKTSALTGEGINDLLEHIEYVADLLELKADNIIPATGWVVEAKISSTQGVVATLLLKEGILKKGEVILSGSTCGRVKTLKDSFNKSLKQAVSGLPVVITGLNEVPQAGDRFYCLGDDINLAKTAAEENKVRSRQTTLAKRTQVTLDNLFSHIEAGNVKELNLIIRADVQGSIDVLTKYLSELSTDEIKIKILHVATGGITEGDVVLAEASNAIIIGFNVVSEERVARIAEEKGIDIRLYTVIYRITEDLKKSMVGLLDPEEREKVLGRATVRDTFKVSKVGTIAGCYVNDGVVTNKARAKLVRDNIVVRDDLVIESLKHFKNDVKEIRAGMECGVKLAKFDDIKVDDILDFYEIVEIQRTL